VCALVGVFFFLWPALTLLRCAFDRGSQTDAIPAVARGLFRSLTPRYERWARARVAAGKAETLDVGNIAGTEWPLFGSVFYLRATLALQEAWDKDHKLLPQAPRESARGAVDATARLVVDPRHAGWVRRHWGDRYLDTEDVFYRMLIIDALAAHARLTASTELLPLLRTQADSMAAELDRSPHGLLDDYPGQCFPVDVSSAWAAIRRADAVLGTDHRAAIERALRGFTGERVGAIGLPPYFADARTGKPADESRGCGNSYFVLNAAELWPDRAGDHYRRYETHFWNRDWLAAGFREFPKGAAHGNDWYSDVDAGPVIRGFGFAASAFGLAAARAHGRFDHAYPLTLEMVAASWPLPNGALLVPRLLSDAADAPLLGEAGILFTLTQRQILTTRSVPSARGFTGMVWLILGLQLAIAVVFCWPAWRYVRDRKSAASAT